MSCRKAEFSELAAEILAGGNILRFGAHGRSMYPSIRDGDTIEVKPIEACAVGLGDVIVCRYGGQRLVVHRVIRVHRENGGAFFLVKGDSARRPDGPIGPEQVLGKVVAIQRGGRTLPMDGGLRKLTKRLFARLSLLSPQLSRLPRIARSVARGVVNYALMLYAT